MRGQEIEQRIRQFLQQVDRGGVKVSEQALKDFAARCEASARKQFTETRKEEFSLRMSNIGRPLRTLWLEKEYGRVPREPESVFNMFYGDLVEAAMMLILESIPEINIDAKSCKTLLKVKDVPVKGTFDLSIDRKILDIKSASPYSYDYKFDSWQTLKEKDDFGYIGQLFGYAFSEAEDKVKREAQGLIVVNKANGHFKVLCIPDEDRESEAKRVTKDILDKVKAFNTVGFHIPECPGVVKEVFNRKETGRTHLDNSCLWCEHKDKCHGKVYYTKDKESKAKNCKSKYYIKLLDSDAEKKTETRVEEFLVGS